MKESFLFASALATEPDVDSAVELLADQVRLQLAGLPPDLMIVFTSPHFMHQVREVVAGLLQALQPGLMLGCTAEGVIGRDQEIENEAAISLVAARMPGVEFAPFILQAVEWPILLLDQEEFRRMIDAGSDSRLFIAIGEPFSTPMEDVLQAFNLAYPNVPMVGGMASAALRPNGNALFLNDQITYNGVVGLAMSGNFDVDLVVSQGCRPIWKPFYVQSALKNVIYNLEGQPPLAWIQDLVPELSREDKALLEHGLLVGRAIDPQQDILGRGDFLIRGVVGVDQQRGAIAIADSVVEGEKIQFHLRDAITAQEDLEMMLAVQAFRDPPDGALLFTCNGRGTRLYDHPNGDISIIQNSLEDVPLAGFFCAGEIGPVGGRNFLHGHTASLAIFRSLPD